jgi:hypothetical protein
MKTTSMQNQKQRYKKIIEIGKNHKPVGHSMKKSVNPLFELAYFSHSNLNAAVGKKTG